MFYPAKVEQVGDRCNISFRDIPEAIRCADYRVQVSKLAEEVLLTAIASYFEDRRPVNLPSNIEAGEVLVEISATVFAKILLLNAMIEQKNSNAELAYRLNLTQHDIEQLLNPHQETEIEYIAQALAALGKRLAMTTV